MASSAFYNAMMGNINNASNNLLSMVMRNQDRKGELERLKAQLEAQANQAQLQLGARNKELGAQMGFNLLGLAQKDKYRQDLANRFKQEFEWRKKMYESDPARVKARLLSQFNQDLTNLVSGAKTPEEIQTGIMNLRKKYGQYYGIDEIVNSIKSLYPFAKNPNIPLKYWDTILGLQTPTEESIKDINRLNQGQPLPTSWQRGFVWRNIVAPVLAFLTGGGNSWDPSPIVTYNRLTNDPNVFDKDK